MTTDWKRSVFFPIPKKGNAKKCSNYHTIVLTSHTSKVMFKVLQAELQQYGNHELPDMQDGSRKGRGTRDQIANIHWIIEKARELKKKNIYFCFIDYTKAFDCVDHNNLENSSRDENTRPPYLPPETSVCRSRSNSENQTWKNRLVPNQERSTSDCILSPCLFNLYAEYIMRNARLNEAQAGIKTARRNIHNLRYADDITLMSES